MVVVVVTVVVAFVLDEVLVVAHNELNGRKKCNFSQKIMFFSGKINAF